MSNDSTLEKYEYERTPSGPGVILSNCFRVFKEHLKSVLLGYLLYWAIHVLCILFLCFIYSMMLFLADNKYDLRSFTSYGWLLAFPVFGVVDIYLYLGYTRFWINLGRGKKANYMHILRGPGRFWAGLAFILMQFVIYLPSLLLGGVPFLCGLIFLLPRESKLGDFSYEEEFLIIIGLIVFGLFALLFLTLLARTLFARAGAFLVDGNGPISSFADSARFGYGSYFSILVSFLFFLILVMIVSAPFYLLIEFGMILFTTTPFFAALDASVFLSCTGFYETEEEKTES